MAEANKGHRGELKIYLGAAPGVGKTYAMLEEAKSRQRDGVDVVVAIVETHGRVETAALLATLEQLPRKVMSYRGRDLAEMDIDAVLERRPQLAIVDELAHTNVPGSRHPKRWQDVEEVLNAGIDVITTLNIQHIESLNDVVARITGVRVQETVPDEILKTADEIELIDLPPEELIERLRQGKVYVPQQITRALSHFFSKGNLTALRELAMRTAAQRVDAEMVAYMRAHAVVGPWPTQERLLVCINESEVAKELVRSGKRKADRIKIPWIVATVLTPSHEAMGVGARAAIAEALRLAESLGAEIATLRTDRDVAGEILRFARSRNASRILIGRARRRWPYGMFREPVAERLIKLGTDFEVTVVPSGRPLGRLALAPLWNAVPNVTGFLEALLGVAVASLVAWPLWSYLPVASLSVIYLVAVLGAGVRHGLWVALFASVSGFLAYNFLFTEPYYSFEVAQHESIVALLVFLISALFTGTLASRLRMQVENMRATQRRTETLYEFSRKIAQVSKLDDVLWAAVHHLAATLEVQSLVLMPGEGGELEMVQGYPTIDDLDPKDWGAAQWAWEKAELAGRDTATLPTADWLFLPMATASAVLGVIGVRFKDPARAGDPETRRLLLAVEDQIAVAIERTRLAADLEDSRVTAESEKLRAALLNSVSHDLRTPLVSIIGAATELASARALSPADRDALTSTVLEEAQRLDRYVQNLLDMTRLGYGALNLRRGAVDLREIVGRVRSDLARVLGTREVVVDMPRDLPPVDVDPVLIGQVFVNVLENAAKHAPGRTAIAIRARPEASSIRVSVIDEGPGIPPADRDKVFDLFYRVRAGDGQSTGTGLGLAIARGLVVAHGGNIRADAGPNGNGTSIDITLPVAKVPDAAEDTV
ncbi:osmosensitive K+ channel histidine kinase KdpD [Blastochloris viridis]|uniref:histidine kinase n=1 Tax=Blastochloris viridis TaxID=1079 RepID=A0A182D4Y1_BLAVI|nr:osmosensitive K+ channel histidine kinase KdpD [Blastochloris viridis]